MKIKDHEIERSERLLLPIGCHFNEERREFLKCMESRDVVACPGSGKTTALLAKLLILSSRMPFSDGRGLCVLTHTNVAIDQIKLKAGMSAEALFRHPNFFGTIQEFTNRFLAIPAYVARFGQRHIRMDEDLYENQAWRVFLDADLQSNGAIYGQLKNQLKGLSRGDQLPQKVKFFRNLQFRFEGDLVDYIRGDTGKTFLKGNGSSASYSDIHGAKHGLLEDGYLQYRDAFPLALWYLQQNPTLPNVFAQRFAFVFIDEAQDTNAEQLAMLDNAFEDRERAVVQFLGDPNQAIYNFAVKKDLDWVPSANPVHFSDTMRYGPTIAAILDTVRIDKQLSLLPNKARSSCPPYLLIFDQGEEQLVLPAFARLLRDNGLDGENDGASVVFKAVGWVGKDKRDQGKLCLHSYLPGYQRRTVRSRRHFKNLLSYIQPQSGSPSAFRNALLRGICQALTVAGIQHPSTNRAFTRNTLLMWLRDTNEPAHQELLTMLGKWCLESECCHCRPREIRDQVATYLRKHWGELKAPTDFNEFVLNEDIVLQESGQPSDNLFHDGDITVEIGTVHSAKGETHTATLYLETYYKKKTDSQRLLPFLKGEYPQGLVIKPEHIENLKIAHVAMSRPTNLLAFACSKDSISGHEDALIKNGWRICTVDEESLD